MEFKTSARVATNGSCGLSNAVGGVISGRQGWSGLEDRPCAAEREKTWGNQETRDRVRKSSLSKTKMMGIRNDWRPIRWPIKKPSYKARGEIKRIATARVCLAGGWRSRVKEEPSGEEMDRGPTSQTIPLGANRRSERPPRGKPPTHIGRPRKSAKDDRLKYCVKKKGKMGS